MGLLKRVGTVVCVGLVVWGTGTAMTAVADTASLTGIGSGGETTVVSGLVVPSNLSGAATFMQFPFAESFPSPSGGRGPRVVLLSYSEQVDSGAFPERLRTLRSVDGGRTFTPLATDVPINAMTQLADSSLVALNFRTARIGINPPPGPVAPPATTPTPTGAVTTPTPTDTSTATPVATNAMPATTPLPTTSTTPAPPPGGGASVFRLL